MLTKEDLRGFWIACWCSGVRFAISVNKVFCFYGDNTHRIFTVHVTNLFFLFQLLPMDQEDLVRNASMAARLPMLFIEEAARNKTFSLQLPASSKFANNAG